MSPLVFEFYVLPLLQHRLRIHLRDRCTYCNRAVNLFSDHIPCIETHASAYDLFNSTSGTRDRIATWRSSNSLCARELEMTSIDREGKFSNNESQALYHSGGRSREESSCWNETSVPILFCVASCPRR